MKKWMALFLTVMLITACFSGVYAASDTQGFVTRCYKVILGRDPDPEGLSYWTDSLNNGSMQAANIIDGFVGSQEFMGKNLNNSDSVEVLYNSMLDRGSDPEGKKNWVNSMNAGSTMKDVINGFCGSVEFGNLCKTYGITPGSVQTGGNSGRQPQPTPTQPPKPNADVGKIRAFVNRCYRVILDREADAGGLQYWTDALANGTKEASNIIDGFVYSKEFQGKQMGISDAVEILYNTMLARGSDPEGMKYWVGNMRSGYSLADLINGFCGSVEFGNLCAQYGITPGKVSTEGRETKTVNGHVVVTDYETVEETIPFETEYQDDSSRTKGEADIVKQEGVNGKKTTVYAVTYTDGVETARTVASENITAAVNKIVNRAAGENSQNTTTTVVETEVVPFETVTHETDMAYLGEVSVPQEGINGEKEVTYEVTKDPAGNVISKVKLSEVVTLDPVNKQVYVGTFVPDITYEVVPLDLSQWVHGARNAELDADSLEWARTMATNNKVEHSDHTGSLNL